MKCSNGVLASKSPDIEAPPLYCDTGVLPIVAPAAAAEKKLVLLAWTAGSPG